ncbi:MAG: DNA-directed RNA polymerase subunit omega [Nitrospirales bacterium]|nr:DNA-directed RNA polymerase subunit omega [Nitrospirales bacterium]
MGDPSSLLPHYQADDRFDSRYRIVLIAAQRAKFLMQGAKPFQPSKFSKETSMAIEETLKHQVEFLTGEEARQAISKAKQTAEREFSRSILEETTSEDAEEIQKQLSVYVDDSPKTETPEVGV